MTQENRELLIKDLCARLPYGVKMNHIADDEISPKTLIGIAKDMITLSSSAGYSCVDVEHYKPYLFPLESMTEEATREFSATLEWIKAKGHSESVMTYDSFDCLNKHHIDYRGLIPMGLAEDATDKNIY